MRIPGTMAISLVWFSAVVLWAGAPTALAGVGVGRIPAPNPILNPPIDDRALGRSQACSGASRAADRACAGDVDDEYWLATGKCLNIADADARRECLNEAKLAMDENRALCAEQYAAREEVCAQVGQDPYDPVIDKSLFLSPAQAAQEPHPYFPLVPGMKWVYLAGKERIEITVTDEIKTIQGVQCFVVRDIVTVGGEFIEKTDDWFAMDTDGNVWYLGEHSETWEEGELVSLDGSWKAGVDGARAGIVMKAQPEVGDVYRQEFLLGEAEDLAEVLSITSSAEVPGGSCDGDCLETNDFTPIEPGTGARKYYARGVGLILEVDVETGETMELQPAPSFGERRGSLSGPLRDAGLLSELRIAGPAGSTGTESPIQFDLGREADVSVDIYDPAGRRIRSIFAGRRDAGRQEFTWQGTDESGRRVASGIYFVRVRAGVESATGRIAVLAR